MKRRNLIFVIFSKLKEMGKKYGRKKDRAYRQESDKGKKGDTG
jgi:hypothetical protein